MSLTLDLKGNHFFWGLATDLIGKELEKRSWNLIAALLCHLLILLFLKMVDHHLCCFSFWNFLRSSLKFSSSQKVIFVFYFPTSPVFFINEAKGRGVGLSPVEPSELWVYLLQRASLIIWMIKAIRKVILLRNNIKVSWECSLGEVLTTPKTAKLGGSRNFFK